MEVRDPILVYDKKKISVEEYLQFERQSLYKRIQKSVSRLILVESIFIVLVCDNVSAYFKEQRAWHRDKAGLVSTKSLRI